MSDLERAKNDISDPNFVVIGVAIPGESPQAIEQFKANYGISFDIWIDTNNNYRELVGPGGRQFPIDVVIDKSGNVRYLENDYYPGEAVKAAKDAL